MGKLYCECHGWCRDFSAETLPSLPSDHHPSCDKYELKRFVRLFDGDDRSFIDTPENQERFVFNDDVTSWCREDVFMTQDQFDRLQDYQGL